MAKVLLVEDDNNLREIYQARLAAEGYDIVAAQNGEEALVVAKQHRPDLIISDVMMPRISGFEMLDILRNTNELKNTKVIMLTALGQAEDQARADNLGADKYLVKSQVTLEDIVNAAKALLDEESDIPTAGSATSNASVAAAEPPVAPQSFSPAPEPVVTAAPEPAVTSEPVSPEPVASEPTNDTVVPASVAPQPNTTVVVPPAPASPVPPAVTVAPVTTPIVAPDPTMPPAPEPVAVAVPPVTVAPVASDPAAATNDTPGTDTTAANPQPLKVEEATVQAQINDFANQPAPTAPLEVTPSESNDAALASAVDQLNASSEPASAAPAAEAATTVPTEPASQGGTKVIQPLNDVSQSGPNLEELLAREEAKEAGSQPSQPAQPPKTPGQDIDPNSIAL